MPFSPSPMEHDPSRIVENVHPDPHNPNHPDFASRGEMQDFLVDRMHGDQPGMRQIFGRWRVYNPVERTRLGFNRMAYLWPVSTARGWAIASGLAMTAINLIPNFANGNIQDDVYNALNDVGEGISAVKDNLQDSISVVFGNEVCPPDGSTRTEKTTIIKEKETFYYSPNKVGESNPEMSIIDKVLDRIEAANTDGSVREIGFDIQANTSDEWLSLGAALGYGIGTKNPENAELGQDRQTDELSAFEKRAAERGIDINGIVLEIAPEEHVLDAAEQERLASLAQAHGYESIVDVLRAQNAAPDRLPPALAEAFGRAFPRNRDTELHLTVVRETHETEVVDSENGNEDDCVALDGDPINHNRDYDFDWRWALWPAMPLFMQRRVQKMRGEWVDFGDLPDPQRLLLHEDGVTENGQLNDSGWAYVRKYMYLFREDNRISKIYEHGYLDANGEEQKLRAIFVDHEPTQESIDTIGRIFQFAGQINGGQLGKDCDAIVVYDRENVGLHGDAKRVGLGLDIQYQGSTLGFAIPSLGLVEMHMPKLPTGGELDQEYNSAAWVLAHELAGHFSDINDEPNRLNPVGHTANGKPLYTLTNRFADAGMQQHRRARGETDRANTAHGNRLSRIVRRILGRQRAGDGMSWTVRRGRGTEPTPEVAEPTVQNMDGATDVRLTEALHVRKQTGVSSEYAHQSSLGDIRTGAAEDWAESAADMTITAAMERSIALPYGQTPERPARVNESEDVNRWVDGYHTSDQWRNTINNRWGSQSSGEETVFVNQPQAMPHWTHFMSVPEDFEFARELAAWARSVNIPEPNDPVWQEVITGQRV